MERHWAVSFLRVAAVVILTTAAFASVWAQEADPIAPDPAAEVEHVQVSDVASSAPAVVPADGPHVQGLAFPELEQPFDLKQFDPYPVLQLIDIIALKSGLRNIVVTREVADSAVKLQTKATFSGVTMREALETVLAVNKLAYETQNGIVTIMTDAEYVQKHGVSFYDNKETAIIELKYASVERVAKLAGEIKSSIGTIVADQIGGKLILIDTPVKVAEMRKVIADSDVATIGRMYPTETRTFVLQHARVDEITKQLQAVLTKEAGLLHSDVRTKSLIVSDLPFNMERIAQIVELFDRRPSEVFIEAKIVQLSLSDDYRLGVNWEQFFDGMNPRFRLESDGMKAYTTKDDTVSPSLNMGYQTIVAGGDITMALEALKKVGDTKILSNPHVAVVDGEEAVIKAITDQPYAEATLESGSTNVVGETIKFIEVGTTLQVTPKISEDGFITMSIRPEVSSVIGTYDAFRKIPIVRKSYAETTVMIKDGETIIIAGMIDEENSNDRVRVPFIGRVPLLGVLFRRTKDLMNSKELVVFMTPRLMSGASPILRMRDVRKMPKPVRTAEGQPPKELKGVR